MSEYPEHLNPFKDSDKKKIGRSLSKSFRGFKGFIRESFRKKKPKNEPQNVEMRKPQDISLYGTMRYNISSLPSPSTHNSFSPALPRSRFKERLSKSSLNNTISSTYDERCNPFALEDAPTPFDDYPVPAKRKSKKRAPLPPSSSNPNVNTNRIVEAASKWSLTSAETDYQSDDRSDDLSVEVTYSATLIQCLDRFNTDMDALNRESSNLQESSTNTPTVIQETRRETEIGLIESINSLDTTTEVKEINNNEPGPSTEGHLVGNNDQEKNDSDHEMTPLTHELNLETAAVTQNIPSESTTVTITEDETAGGDYIPHESPVTKNNIEKEERTATDDIPDELPSSITEEDILEKGFTEFSTDDSMKYIDEETTCSNIEDGAGEKPNGIICDVSAVPKHRKSILDKDVLLGENPNQDS